MIIWALTFVSDAIAGQTIYEVPSNDHAILIVFDTILPETDIVVDCDASLVSIGGFSFSTTFSAKAHEPPVEELSIYRNHPHVVENVSRGIDYDTAIQICREEEDAFRREFESTTRLWSKNKDDEWLATELERLRSIYASTVERVGFSKDDRFPFPYYKLYSSSIPIYAGLSPEPQAANGCEVWNRLAEYISTYIRKGKTYRLVWVSPDMAIDFFTCSNEEDYQKKISECVAAGAKGHDGG